MTGSRNYRIDGEGRGSAQNSAHVVWIGDLIKHENDPGGLELLEFGRGQGIGFGQQPIVHGVRAEAARDRVRPHQFGFDCERHPVLGETSCRVGGGVESPDASRWIFEGRFHGVPAVENRSCPQIPCLAARWPRILAPPRGTPLLMRLG